MKEREGGMLFCLTGKSSIQTEGSSINMLRFALADGAGAGARRSLPV